MAKTFKTKVNNNFEFEFKKKEVSNLDALQISKSKYHILHNNKPYKTEIIESHFNNKIYKVKVNNSIYNVNIINELDVLIKELGFTIGTTKHINSIKAPMPGLILDINIEVGQEVKEGDSLLVLEAMKMENVISSPREGIIKTLTVNKGETVLKGQLLIEFQ
ncbi:acetyl-CoA carboxylase biotin carboxyl carrier protein subunit [Seonamhaeicola sp.]|uniref:acetyl-CoA carboxylase biotin carboxyl carrier protein subunit n=1 Tax=Seonamhaeicola sp. TaxID=1912245 RepID=UPI00356646B3